MIKPGRNEPCHCGSGKKYKNCHQPTDGQYGKKNNSFLILGIAVLVIIVLFFGVYINQRSSGDNAPGNAPPGKVWSSEHGHWHDAE